MRRGELLAELAAPELDHALHTVETRISVLRWQLEHRATQPAVLANSAVIEQELVKRLTEAAGYAEQRRQLQVTAPFDGAVTAITAYLTPGRWLSRTQPLIEIASTSQPRIEAFVDEEALDWIAPGAEGRFFPDSPERSSQPVRVAAVERVAQSVLTRPQLASIHGGPIAVRPEEGQRLTPVNALYRVMLEPLEPLESEPGRMQTESGVVRLAAAPAPLYRRLTARAAAILLRESGF
ncbi:hypothetical protein CCP1ISM_3440001 [Azospirillaceae bacterium]